MSGSIGVTRIPRIGLGTAQLGARYGIANTLGRLDDDEARSLIGTAHDAGVRVVDTAALYGESEARLGRTLGELPFDIVTKTSDFRDAQDGPSAAAALHESFRRSLSRLDRPAVYGLLVHHVSDLLGPFGPWIWEALQDIRERGGARRIGVSAYDGADLDAAMEVFELDLVQVPFSILDQRLLRSGQLRSLAASNVEVHVRSVFMQGLLLMPRCMLPKFARPWAPHLARLRTTIEGRGLTMAAGALSFVLDQPEVSVAIVGADTATQFAEMLRAGNESPGLDLAEFAVDDPDFLNPSRWPRA